MKRIIYLITILFLNVCNAGDYQVCFTPGQECTALIVNSISQAHQSIFVQAYSFTSVPIAKALADAKKRGVDVEVILDKGQFMANQYTSATFLINNHIPTWIDYKPAIAHNKVMIIDKKEVITGSFNFTRAAQNRNAENVLIINNVDLAQSYLDNWNNRKVQSLAVNKQNFLKNLIQKNPGYKLGFNLPINMYAKNIFLSIEIPKDLKLQHEYPGNPYITQFSDKKLLITISHQKGGKFQANNSLDKIIKAMQADSQVTILQKEDHTYPGYIDGYRIVKLSNTKKDTNEIVYIYAVSGPDDSASVSYSMKIHGDDNVDIFTQKVRNAFNANVKVVDMDSSH